MYRWLSVVAFAVSVSCAHTESTEPPPAAQEPDVEPSPSARPDAEVATADPPRPREPGTIFRDELLRATKGGKPGYLMGQLGPEPYRPTGRFQGWRVTRVFPDDPALCRDGCDLHPDDIILTVNGSPLERPEHLSALVESIGEMQQLRVRLVRDGKLHERDYTIVEG